MRQPAAVFGMEAGQSPVIDDLVLRWRCDPGPIPHGVALTVVSIWSDLRPHIAAPSRNHWYSTHHLVVIDADNEVVVVIGRPLHRRPGRNPAPTPAAPRW